MTSVLKREMRELKDRMRNRTATRDEWDKFSDLASQHPRVAQALVDDHYRQMGEQPFRA